MANSPHASGPKVTSSDVRVLPEHPSILPASVLNLPAKITQISQQLACDRKDFSSVLYRTLNATQSIPQPLVKQFLDVGPLWALGLGDGATFLQGAGRVA